MIRSVMQQVVQQALDLSDLAGLAKWPHCSDLSFAGLGTKSTGSSSITEFAGTLANSALNPPHHTASSNEH